MVACDLLPDDDDQDTDNDVDDDDLAESNFFDLFNMTKKCHPDDKEAFALLPVELSLQEGAPTYEVPPSAMGAAAATMLEGY